MFGAKLAINLHFKRRILGVCVLNMKFCAVISTFAVDIGANIRCRMAIISQNNLRREEIDLRKSGRISRKGLKNSVI